MNIFRFCGDMLHLTSIMLLVFKLHRSKSCVGVSCRMQEIYAVVFICRYLDLLWSFISVYNTVMKITYITTTCYLIYLMRLKTPICQTYERSTDSFQYELYLLGPALVLGLICTEEYTIPDILWSSSIWLESVAIIPQLVLLQQIREVEPRFPANPSTMRSSVLQSSIALPSWAVPCESPGHYSCDPSVEEAHPQCLALWPS